MSEVGVHKDCMNLHLSVGANICKGIKNMGDVFGWEPVGLVVGSINTPGFVSKYHFLIIRMNVEVNIPVCKVQSISQSSTCSICPCRSS